MQDLLIQAGLTELQATTYLFLLEHGSSTPPFLAKATGMTRTNAYKVLDSLEELGLASRSELRKKFVYQPADPSALANLVAEKRNTVLALEQNIRQAMQQLRNTYRKSNSSSATVQSHSGKTAMITAYEDMANQKTPIYFVKARSDIPFLGYETMARLRQLPAKHGTQRYGITQDGPEAPVSPEIDARSNLHRTWITNEQYTAPVEWTVSGDQLLLQVFDDKGRVIKVKDSQVAESFRQLWNIINDLQRSSNGYKEFPRKAKRKV